MFNGSTSKITNSTTSLIPNSSTISLWFKKTGSVVSGGDMLFLTRYNNGAGIQFALDTATTLTVAYYNGTTWTYFVNPKR